MIDFSGKVAVVTGASSGLGRRLATDLADRGAVVVGLARRADVLAGVEVALRRASPRSSTTPCDVSDIDRFRAVLADVEREYGSIDILVNSAGFEQPTSVEDADFDLYRATMATNFLPAVAGTLAVLPGMLARRWGIVVNISSDHGRTPAPGTPAYSASKAALSAFTESVALEVADRGVRLHVLYPGWVPTPLGRAVVDHGMPTPPRAVRRTEGQVAALTLRRMGRRAIDINAARVAALSPLAKVLAPAVWRQQLRKRAIKSETTRM